MQKDVPIRAILAYSDFPMSPTGASVRISVTVSLGCCVLLDLSKPTVLDCMRHGVTVGSGLLGLGPHRWVVPDLGCGELQARMSCQTADL